MTLPGPKLQSNIFDILVRFRKELVALAGDVSQMYHQYSWFFALRTDPSIDSFGEIWIQVNSQRRTNFSVLCLEDAIVRSALSTFGSNTHVIAKTSTLWQLKKWKTIAECRRSKDDEETNF